MIKHNKLKIRFYHVPKSGGTTIFNMTQPWKDFKRAHKNKNHVCIAWFPPENDEIGMTIIRHPYSRFESAFYHIVDACNPQFYYRHAKQSDCETMRNKLGIHNFNYIFKNNPNDFLIALTDRNNPHHKEAQKIFQEFDIFKTQFYWLSDLFGLRIHPGIKIILHQENLRNEFNEIAKQLGYYPNWPNNVNKRLTKNSVPLNEHSKSIIRNLYKKDFKYFQFSV